MKMTVQKLITYLYIGYFFLVYAEARWHNIIKRETAIALTTICDPVYNNVNKVQCYCVRDVRDPTSVRTADCYVTVEDVQSSDPSWKNFKLLNKAQRLTLTNTRGISLKYIPTTALKHTESLLKLDVKYGNIEKIPPFAFANLSTVEEISLRDSQIQVLQVNSFAHHRDLIIINLDKNNIVEINRDVFIDLPSLEKLYLTSNKITTIHDRAFVHLVNLRELEINMNKLFSLNSETFSGLKKLQKLDLSSNSLEVIGDNTFLPLKHLHTLNIEDNKIQMLDDKAFRGLSMLQSLSLAHNKLSSIGSSKVFEELESLRSLSLRGNGIRELKPEVMTPILTNFYEIGSSLDVEDNNFPCDCRLDWFILLMNQTKSKNLNLALENLKCNPDDKVKKAWSAIEENDKNTGQMFEEDSSVSTDYEYYDDTQLNGKLFYTDIRFVLNCTNTFKDSKLSTKETVVEITTVKVASTKMATTMSSLPTVTTSSTPKTTTVKFVLKPEIKITNHGLLDLSVYETTPKTDEDQSKKESNARENEIEGNNKRLYTTTRLATVSAKPIEEKMYQDEMASDEVEPNKIKAHRSIQEDVKDTPKITLNNSANKPMSCVIIITMMLFSRLF